MICDFCDDSRHIRCQGRKCDGCLICSLQARPNDSFKPGRMNTPGRRAVLARAKARSKGIRRPGSGRKSPIPLPMQRAIAAALAEGTPKTEVARRSGATYEQVRTILRTKVSA